MPKQEIHFKIPIYIEPDGEGFHANTPSFKGCRVGGATKEEAMRNMEDALYLYITSLLKRGKPLPIGGERNYT